MMKTPVLTFLVMVCSLLISSCGFRPVYGTAAETQTGVETYLALTAIANIPDREGQMLRNKLIDRFYREGRPANPRYQLVIDPIRESLVDLDITVRADTTRGQLILSTDMELLDLQTDKVVLKRDLQATTSYNILAGEFATRVTEENARANAIEDLARQIELQLSLYFNR